MSPTPPRCLPPQSRGRRHARESGAVTAEMAMALPALMVILLMCLWGVLYGETRLRAEDAARVTARAVARGDSETSARSLAQQTVRRGSTVSIHKSGSIVTVTVRTEVPTPAGIRTLMHPVTVSGEASAPMEKQ